MKGKSGRGARNVFLFLLVVMLTGLQSCALWDDRNLGEFETAYGPNPPTIEASYADTDISPKAGWRIYLKGYDPDGDMTFVNVWLDTPCGPDTPSRLRIDQDQREDISGYLVLYAYNLAGVPTDMFGGWLRLRIMLEDRVGHHSEPVELSPRIYLGAASTEPPQSAFEERSLGKIPTKYNSFEPCGIGVGAAVP